MIRRNGSDSSPATPPENPDPLFFFSIVRERHTNKFFARLGTGSGSFSHSTARTIGPSGHIWSYEFHEARASKARWVSPEPNPFAHPFNCLVRNDAALRGHVHSGFSQEFADHGMSNVTLTHRNVCKDGFTVLDTADAGNYTQTPIFSPCLPVEDSGALREENVDDSYFRFPVFLDLPAPWEAVQHAKSALRVRNPYPPFSSSCRSPTPH